MPRRSRTYECPPDHKHSETVNCYKRHGCGCRPCRAANAALSHKNRVRGIIGDAEPPIPADNAQAHLLRLLDGGVSCQTVADRAGLGVKTVQRVAFQGGTIFPFTEAAILGVTLDKLTVNDRRLVDSAGTRRRVEALIWSGWPLAVLAVRLGWRVNTSSRLLADGMVQLRTARRIHDMYDVMVTETPPDTYGGKRARLRARRLGYHGPDAWIDVDIDDPEATPDVTVAEDTPGWEVVELALLHDLGESPSMAVAALGATPEALDKLARRYHRPDLARWVSQAA